RARSKSILSEDSQHCPPRPSVAGGPHLFPATGDQVTGPTTTLLECEASGWRLSRTPKPSNPTSQLQPPGYSSHGTGPPGYSSHGTDFLKL
ncbi:mCG126309, partial [Mus musculus]